MLPQRSQYFSSILCGRKDSTFALILFSPFYRNESPGGGKAAEVAGDGLPASAAKMPATGLDFFSKACFPANRFGAPLRDFRTWFVALVLWVVIRSYKPVLVSTSEVAFLVAGLENSSVLNDDAQTARETCLPQQLGDR